MSSQVSVFNSTENREKFMKAYQLLMESWTAPYEDQWVDTSFGKTHVITAGPADGEPLVLLPGVQATGGMWGPMIPALAETRRVYCIELIDQVGLSEPSRVLTGTEDSNAWIEETLDGLSLNKVDLLGNSLGSFLASCFTVSHPERVRRLVLTAPAATLGNLRFSYILKAMMASSPSAKARFLKKTAAGLVDEEDPLFRVLLSAMTESKVISKIIPRPLTQEELLCLKAPTLVMLGSEDISAGKPSDRVVAELSKQELDFQFEILHGAGHLWTGEQYRSAGDRIKLFLDETA